MYNNVTVLLFQSSDAVVVILFTRFFYQDDGFFSWPRSYNLQTCRSVHTSRPVNSQNQDTATGPQNTGAMVSVDDSDKPKAKRKKLKGKRAVTRFLKSLRWKKEREFQRMTAEEKILKKLKLVSCYRLVSL